MLLYAVKKDETLADVAAKFNTTIKRLVADNGLITSMPLVEGQILSIVAPTSVYTASAGESAKYISRALSVDWLELLQNNHDLLTRDSTYNGQELVLQKEKRGADRIRTISSISPNIRREELLRALPFLSYASMRSCALRSDGSALCINDKEKEMKALAREYSVMPILEIRGARVRGEDWYRAIADYDSISRTASNIKHAVLSGGYGGLHLNLGELDTDYGEGFVELVATLRALFSDWGAVIFVSLPKTTVMNIDVELLGENCDYMIVSPNGLLDVLEIDDLTSLLSEVVDAQKLSVTFPMSATDCAMDNKGQCIRKEHLSSAQAIRLSVEKNAKTVFDETDCLSKYSYVDMEMGNAVEHRVSYQSPMSAFKLLELSKKYQAKLLSVCHADSFFDSFWSMMTSCCSIEKLI